MRYSIIKENDIANSDTGVNLSLWTQGCPHHCKNCFNVETWDFEAGKEFTKDTYIEIYNKININGINRNLSILGGEPLSIQNIEGVVSLCKKFKEDFPNKSIYIWTGYIYEKLTDKQKEILKYTTTLIDGKFEEENKDLSLKLRGSKNQRIINVKESLKQNKVILYYN